MHIAKLLRYKRIELQPFLYGTQECPQLMQFWADTLFQKTSPDMNGKRVGGPFIYTRSFSDISYTDELRNAAHSLSHFMRYFTIHGFVPEMQPYSSTDTMIVRTYLAECPHNMLSALFFMERLSDRAGEAYASEYYNLLKNSKFMPSEQQWADLPKTDSWLQHIAYTSDKCSVMISPQLR